MKTSPSGGPSLHRTVIEHCRVEQIASNLYWHQVKPCGFLDGFLVKLEDVLPNMDAGNPLRLYVQLAYHRGGVAAQSDNFEVQSVSRPLVLKGEADKWQRQMYRGEVAILP